MEMKQTTIFNWGTRAVVTVLSLMLSLTVFAQEKITVSGVVVDETGLPMIGAGVIEEGNLANGTVTDIDGNYTITVPSDASLNFNFISYKTEIVKVGGKTKIDIQLKPDTNLLDEVVVIGYGTMKKSDLTGSVASVSAKAIEDFKSATVLEALGGQVAGVNVMAADGTPGAGFDIKIRGVGSVNGDTSPLYIVDGFEVDNIDYLASQDIQSVDFLKDASASAIYGARAANGVVLVTTKSGIEGAPQISYNGSATYRVLSKRVELLSPYEFVKLQVESNPTKYGSTYYKLGEDSDGEKYVYQTAEDYLAPGIGIDWQDEAFRPTWSQNHDVSIRGGVKDSKYTVSFSHFDEDGIFANSGYRKDNARVKIFQKVTNWLNLDFSLNYTNTLKTGTGTSGGLLANILRYRPTGGLNVSDYTLRYSMYDPLSMSETNFNSSDNNPILQAESVDDDRSAEQWIANASLNFTLAKGLTFKTSATYNANYQRRDIFYGENSNQAYRGGGVYGSTQMTRALRWQNSNVLTYKTEIAKKHSIDAMLGHEVSYNGNEYLLGQSKDFPFSDLKNDNLGLGATPSQVTTYKAENLRQSFFARAFYNYRDRYMLTGTVRADASTVFSAKHKWGFFPSFSAAWNIAKEDFMKDASGWLSNFKFRAGWGTVGNDRISNYLSMDLYTMSKYGIGSSQTTVLTPKQIANENLKWEGSTTTNVGLDFGVFDSRLNLTVDAFIKDTKDLLLAQNLAHVTGFDSQWQNIGKIRNKGIEITVNSVNFSNRNFFWSTDFNISFLENTLVALQDGTDYMFSRSGFNSNFSGYDYVAYVGSALGDMYGYVYDGVYQYSDFEVAPGGGMTLKEGVADISEHAGKAAAPGMAKYKDMDGDGVITTADRSVIGNGQADWYGGITNSFNIYGIDFSFMFQFSYGNDVYNATRMYCTQSNADRTNQWAEVADRWTPTNASNAVPSYDGYVPSELYSRFIEDGSYLRLKNVTLGYTLPEDLTRRAKIKKVRLYVTAQNLFCLSKYSGYDPEVNTLSSPLMPGFDWGGYPKSKAYTFGLELQF